MKLEQERLAVEEAEKKRQHDLKLEQERMAHELRMRELESTRNRTEDGRCVPKAPKLLNFTDDKDSIEEYIIRFERFATENKWPTSGWASNLSALLSGKALGVYSRMASEDAKDFEKLKKALLARYDLNAEGFRKKMRTASAEEMESPEQYYDRLCNYMDKWMELSDTKKDYKSLFNLMVMEQFIEMCSLELSTFLKERSCKEYKEVLAASEQYLMAHGKQLKDCQKKKKKEGDETGDERQSYCVWCHRYGHNVGKCEKKAIEPGIVRCYYCRMVGHSYQLCRKYINDKRKNTLQVGAVVEIAGAGQSNNTYPDTRTCFICRRVGHIATACPEKKKPPLPYTPQNSLTDSSQTPRANQINRPQSGCACVEQQLEDTHISDKGGAGCVSMCKCVGDETIETACGKKIEFVKCGCDHTVTARKMPVMMGTLNGKSVEVLRDTGCTGVVTKKAFVKREQYTGRYKVMIRIDKSSVKAPTAMIEVETPYYTGVVEAVCLEDALYDLIIGNIDGAKDPMMQQESCLERRVEQAGNVITRAQSKKAKEDKQLKVFEEQDIAIDKNELIRLQQDDQSLRKYLTGEVDDRQLKDRKVWYSVENGVLYRYFQSISYRAGEVVRRIMVPSGLRSKIIGVAHDSMVSGHMAVRRTYDRILANFYWPGIWGDVVRYCRSCDVCQRTVAKGKVAKVPLEKLPIIETPFERMSVDIVGPIYPASNRGHRYILTMIDHASRYPEAVCLKYITAESVAEGLVSVFCRVGIPKEILSDQGSQFMSEVMKEVNRLLSIKQLITAPYHPMCNGLVENLNGTLKGMLKKVCADQPKEWDRYVGPLLFAYREIPQESTGFSPFELLYGRTIRGPLQILQDLWTREDSDSNSDVYNSYQYVLELKQRLESTLEIARENLVKSQVRYKHYYDKRSRHRKLKVGDSALVLLPTDNNKLLMQWKGPFKVVETVGVNDYRLDVNGTAKLFHINLLKQYVSRGHNVADDVQCGVLEMVDGSVLEYEDAEQDDVDDEDFEGDDLIVFPKLEQKETYLDVKLGHGLSSSQESEVRNIVYEFRDVFSDVPGKTNLIEHEMELTSLEPVRTRPYPIPYSMREELRSDVKKMLELGVIRPSNSKYASPVVCVRKKDGSNRITVDFRAINRLVHLSPEPMIDPQDIFARVSTGKFFTKFDMTKGYWQIPMKKEDIPKTCFVTPDGAWEFLVMPFGPKNSGSTFVKMMRKLTLGMANVVHYIDDCLVYTETWNHHLEVVRELLSRVRKANLRVRPTKCEFGAREIEFVGHTVGHGVISLLDANVKKIMEAPVPTTKKQVRSFLGMTGFYRKFISCYSDISMPLTELTKKGKPNRVEWAEEQQMAYDNLKLLLASRPILHLPDMQKTFVLRTDASNYALGAVLLQSHNGEMHPIAYASRKLLPRECRYATIEKECLAIVWAVRKFYLYLGHNPFILQTDHQPLIYMNRARFLNDRVMRWAMALQPFHIQIESMKGSMNVGADCMSRLC